MLAKKYRLPVASVLGKQGVTRRGRYFLLKIFPAGKKFSRFAVVVGAAAIPKATARNSLKRLVYRLAPPLLPPTPADYLLITQRGQYDSLTADVIIKELKNLFI